MVIRKEDIRDLDIVDAIELASDGYYIFLTTTLISTTTGTNTILINMPSDGEGILYGADHLVEKGDKAWITGTSDILADGYFIVNTILDDTSFTIDGYIASSIDGYISFMYPSGAKQVGFNVRNYPAIHVTHTNVQQAIEDLDLAITETSGYLTKQIEIDFGTIPTNYKTFIISDLNIFPSSKLFPTQAGNAPTGRSSDENEMDPIIFSAIPSSGQFTLIATSINGPIVGKYKINYGIG